MEMRLIVSSMRFLFSTELLVANSNRFYIVCMESESSLFENTFKASIMDINRLSRNKCILSLILHSICFRMQKSIFWMYGQQSIRCSSLRLEFEKFRWISMANSRTDLSSKTKMLYTEFSSMLRFYSHFNLSWSIIVTKFAFYTMLFKIIYQTNGSKRSALPSII